MPNKSIKELAQMSLDVQNACNLSGVVRSYSGVLTDLWSHADAAPGRGTNWVNQHPIAVLFADKIASLTGTQDLGRNDVISAGYAVVYKLAAGEPNEKWGQ